eukprot:10545515-Alexandrium_andersonii.AAC.1
MRLPPSRPSRDCKPLRAHFHTGATNGSARYPGEPLRRRIICDSFVIGACELGARTAVCGLVKK